MQGLQQFWQQTDGVGRAVALLLLAILVSAATVDGWTIMRFLGARGAGTARALP